jgi:flagellar hook-associated protein 2
MSSAVSAASSGTANSLITSTGIGSGLNISAIVSSLTANYGAAQTNSLAAQQTTLNAQVSAFGTFSSALSTLQATLSTLENPTQLAGYAATVADKTIASATTSSEAVAGQYSLLVQNLATAATLTSQAFTGSSTTAIGTGTLNITVGAASTSITIDSTNDTLSGIASAINSASNNPGVTASVISTTGGQRLVISGTSTGTANAITVTQSGGNGGLAPLVYDPANQITNLTQTQAAQDANFTLNGYPATSANNLVSTAITGVTLDLLGVSAANTPTTVSVTPDSNAAATSIGTFVTAANGVISAIQSLTGYDPSTQTAGPLNGNATLESFQNQLANILDTVQSGNTGGITSLADIGITTDANSGSLVSDSGALNNALTANLTSVGNLLGGTNGIATKLNSLINQYTGPGGLLSSINQGLQASLTNVSQQQSALQTELAAYSATLTAQYNAMDTAVASLKEMQTYLTAEFNPNQSTSSSSSSTSSLGSGTLGT